MGEEQYAPLATVENIKKELNEFKIQFKDVCDRVFSLEKEGVKVDVRIETMSRDVDKIDKKCDAILSKLDEYNKNLVAQQLANVTEAVSDKKEEASDNKKEYDNLKMWLLGIAGAIIATIVAAGYLAK